MEEAEPLCDRLAIMDHGRILEMGTVDELVGRRFKERAVRFDRDRPASTTRGSAGLPASTRWRTRTTRSALHPRRAGDDRRRCSTPTEALGVEPQNLAVRRPTLEDVFLDLTGRALRD